MFTQKVKLSKKAFEKARIAAEIAGASSVEEFVERAVIKESDAIIAGTGKGEVSADDVEAITNQLKGLGYLE